jgi:ribosome-associated heat shock protein Hsp15
MARQRRPPDDAPAPDAPGAGRERLDKWLWAARFFKTRALAAEAVERGKVLVHGARAKPGKALGPGEEVRFRHGPFEHVLLVRGVSARRGPAREAALLYEETPASIAARAVIAAHLRNMSAGRIEGGRPTKKDRRDIDRVLGDRRKS